MNSVGLLFCLYVLVLVLMSVKYLFIKEKLSNNDILIHLLVIVILGLLVLYTTKNERFSGAPLDYLVSERNGVQRSDNNTNNANNDATYQASNSMNAANGSPLYYSETADMIEKTHKKGASLDYLVSNRNGVNNPPDSPMYEYNNANNNKPQHHKNGAPLDYSVSERNGVDSSPVTEHFSGAPLNYKVSARNNVTQPVAAATAAAAATSSAAADDDDLPSVDENGAPLDYKMGPYSDVRLETEKQQHRRMLTPGFKNHMFMNEKDSNCGDQSSPCSVPLQRDPNFTDPMGGSSKLNLGYNNESNPSVDGKKDGKKSMFMFAHNVCHPGCCPSDYSCDHGCVCTNKEQRDYISRGGAMKMD
jgi:hypothetical protein